jgi:hypothetical protein
MRTILQINPHDINEMLLQTIKQLLLQNSEILIQSAVHLEEFDATKSVDDVMQALSAQGHNAAFLKDIEKGLKSSSVYAENEH